MRKIIALVVVALVLVGCQPTEPKVEPHLTEQDIQKLSDKQVMLLLGCQERKVVDALGPKKANEYFERIAKEIIEKDDKNLTVQYLLAQDGYHCDADERAEFAGS